MKTEDFDYYLPQNLIAQTPVYPRDSSRLLVYDGHTQNATDRHFFDLPSLLKSGDVLVINNTKVLPARIFGKKSGTGANIEFLLHKRLNLTDWEVVTRPAKRLHIGDEVVFCDRLKAVIVSPLSEGEKIVRFIFDGVFEDILHQIGNMPLPPYIHEKLKDKDRYQTVYALFDGSSAAPTAGLHFTPELILALKNKGVIFAEVLLHVGLGTFKPVKAENISEHRLHSEYYSVSEEAAKTVNDAKREGRRVIAVGTTSVRVLESASDESGLVAAKSGNTEIFIYPPYQFKAIDGMITNFHLPKSSLIMLVSAFLTKEKTMQLYQSAVQKQYRFFSFGDAMLLFGTKK
jgi:S-adenosylmethionine:tRNA ribosyltransferase-isomerase